MGGRSGQSLGSGSAIINSSSLSIYKSVADDAIKEFGIKGEITILESKIANGGYAKQNIANYDNGGNPFKNEILINPNTKMDLKKVIRHELKHISQGQKGKYYQKKDVNGVRYHYWEGKKVISSDDFRKINNNLQKGNNFAKYQSLPWEVDARSTQ